MHVASFRMLYETMIKLARSICNSFADYMKEKTNNKNKRQKKKKKKVTS